MAEDASESLEVSEAEDRERADKVLTRHLPDLSRSQVQRLFAKGLVWREETALTKNERLRAGDVLSFSIPPVVPLDLRPVALPLEVLFETDDLIAVNKAPGMVVHPGAGTGEDTLVHALLHHCAGQLSGIGGVERPGIVHRLDRDTSGVIVAAKSDRAYQGLAQAFAERTLEKHYTALVRGVPRLLSGRIEAPIGRHPNHRTRMAVRDDGRPARTDWKLREAFGDLFAWLDLRLHTGRTHQIRVHCAHLAHPLAGDQAYGFRARKRDPVEVSRVMLHAARLVLTHPVSGIPLTLEAPVPEDFSSTVEALRRG
ncbi:MAG: RluA family pseudouridine synthase [Verrucomicrobiota bacterium]